MINFLKLILRLPHKIMQSGWPRQQKYILSQSGNFRLKSKVLEKLVWGERSPGLTNGCLPLCPLMTFAFYMHTFNAISSSNQGLLDYQIIRCYWISIYHNDLISPQSPPQHPYFQMEFQWGPGLQYIKFDEIHSTEFSHVSGYNINIQN